LGSGCGAIGRAVTSDAVNQRFESRPAVNIDIPLTNMPYVKTAIRERDRLSSKDIVKN